MGCITWHILDIKGQSIHRSPTFHAFGLRWHLKFYPHGYDRDNYGYVAIALVLEELANEDVVFVQGDIYLTSPAVTQPRKCVELRRVDNDGWVQFSSSRMAYGQKRCMTSAELQDSFLSQEDLHVELDGFAIHRPVYQLVNTRMFSSTLPKFVTLVRGRFIAHNSPQEMAAECEAPSLTIVGNQDDDDRRGGNNNNNSNEDVTITGDFDGFSIAGGGGGGGGVDRVSAIRSVTSPYLPASSKHHGYFDGLGGGGGGGGGGNNSGYYQYPQGLNESEAWQQQQQQQFPSSSSSPPRRQMATPPRRNNNNNDNGNMFASPFLQQQHQSSSSSSPPRRYGSSEKKVPNTMRTFNNNNIDNGNLFPPTSAAAAGGGVGLNEIMQDEIEELRMLEKLRNSALPIPVRATHV